MTKSKNTAISKETKKEDKKETDELKKNISSKKEEESSENSEKSNSEKKNEKEKVVRKEKKEKQKKTKETKEKKEKKTKKENKEKKEKKTKTKKRKSSTASSDSDSDKSDLESESSFSVSADNEITPKKKQPKREAKSKANLDINKLIDENLKSQDGGISSNFAPMLAETYNGTEDINGWLLSEKLDGVRCIWDGTKISSRNNNKFYPPTWFIENFPQDMALDGELFMERNQFSATISIVKKQTAHDGWKKIKFMIFDAPLLSGNLVSRLKAVEKKLNEMKEILPESGKYLELLNQEICVDKDYLDKRMKEIIALKGEGCIVRDPNSLYENRRSKSMLKVKEFHDAEATILEHLPGTGRLSSMMGAVKVKNDEGIVFKVGSGFDDSQRRKPPKIGSRITYRYFELSKDRVPRFPTFVRVHPGI